MKKSNRSAPAGKILAFDLETASLDADRGHIICVAAKWVGRKTMYTWRIDETAGYGKTPASFFDDSKIVKELTPLLEEADAVLAHYGSGFDVPYVNTRAIINGLQPPAKLTVIDPWKTSKAQLRMSRNGLAQIADAVNAKHRKTHVAWSVWETARYGCTKSIDKLLKYNINDVLALEDVYVALRPLMHTHPYVGPTVAGGAKSRCPACGSNRSRSVGWRRTRTFEIHRRVCSSCGNTYEDSRRKIA